MYDLILKGGEVIDPAQGIHDKWDIGIKDGKIAFFEKNLSESEAKEVIPLKGKWVTPGLIDLHCHAAEGLVWFGLPPDEIGLDSGVTLLCDGGSSGAANFHTLRRFIMECARTDMLCFLHLGITGLLTMPEIWDEHDIDPEWTKAVIEENRDLIRGIKLRAMQFLVNGIGIKAIEIAKKLSTDLRLPFVMHIGDMRERVTDEIMDDFTRAAVKLMEKGDILTHLMAWSAGGLILPDGTVYPELLEAQKRGVILDACHGFSNFSLAVARQAFQKGILPDIISTDLTIPSLRVAQSLAVTMSKFLNLGLTIDQMVEMTTINPARALGEQAKRGSLKIGMPANITVLEMVEGDYLFSDGNGRNSMEGNRLLEPRLVLKNGVPMPCRSCYHIPPVYKTYQPPIHKKT